MVRCTYTMVCDHCGIAEETYRPTAPTARHQATVNGWRIDNKRLTDLCPPCANSQPKSDTEERC